MKPLETKLITWLDTKAPYHIPENGRRSVVSALPWVALIIGLLALFATWSLYQAATVTNGFVNYANYISVSTGAAPTITLSPLIWVGLAALLIEAVLMLAAFPGLRSQKKQGWNLLFYSMLLNAVYAVINLFIDTNIGAFLASLLGSVIGLYILFQVRGYYLGVKPKVAGPSAKPDTNVGAGTDVGNGKPAAK